MKLLAKSIEKSYKGRKVVKGISLEVAQGEIVGLLGPNGAGKTTSFYMIVGLIKPNDGFIYLNDQEITKFPMYQRAQRGIGYLAQEASIFPDLSVENNLMGIAELSNGDKGQAINIVKKIIDEFDLRNILQIKGRMLSGGQRRKVEIARTLICKPKIMLLDEPFAGIDPIAVEEIKELLQEICKKEISILITDHNVRETLSLCHKAIILSDGKIIAEGNEESLKENAHVQKKYFGKMFS